MVEHSAQLVGISDEHRVLSGMQPSGDSLHLGNYVGALLNWVTMQEKYDAFFFIPDLHGITVPHEPAELRSRTRNTAAQFLAGGIDVERSTLFVQSHVPEHVQLSWILTCITGMGEASRMTQFKDKSAKQGADSAGVGLLTYPMLMAADILLYQPDGVPVGDDQKQHVELARNLAQRFNHRFGETFRVPEPFIPEVGARIYDLQDPTTKMSKSASSPNGRLNILDTDKKLAKKIKSAVTDAGTEIRFDRETKPGISNLLSIYSAVSGKSIDELVEEYQGKMYGHLKVDLADAVVARFGPIRDRALELLEDPAELDALLARGAEKARAIASPLLDDVYAKVGFLPSTRA
ncbi:tryptophan--tRNA ligase [Nesterenkonia xinjiangensis]|uniref:Tryptophan--tRNA ligase n=1 Tax=Nesterenkonia xinjiangensis TaxID=225327 RepID=A0A7Z0GJH6_9MICC|nr:tryptophan--tRNA ligase [Nesterenkonia xinjiangensis]NYJ77130.1 tryptophanyl-tRNA synthetase [Nesterenkonia xinjiangensis]